MFIAFQVLDRIHDRFTRTLSQNIPLQWSLNG